MYPEYSNNYLERSSNKRLVILKWVAILVPVGLILLAIISFLLQPAYTQFSVTSTELRSQQNYGHLSGDDLYGYNGLLFYKQNLKTGNVTALSDGQRLPQIERIFWAGDKGVLLKFSGSYIATDVERIFGVTAGNIDASLPPMIESYTWFYDFSSSSLKQVAKTNVLPNLAYYSAKDNGFYFMTYDDIGPSPHNPILFYDVQNDKTTQISYGSHVTDMTSISQCPDGIDATVCFVARDDHKPAKKHLYSIKTDGEKKSLLESDSKLLPTNNRNFYITTSHQQAASSGSNVENVDLPGEATVVLHDIANKTSRTLDFTAGSADPTVYLLEDNRFYVLHTNSSDQTDNTVYRSGELTSSGSRSKEMTIENSAGDNFEGTINFINSVGNDGITLATTIDDQQVLLSQHQTETSLAKTIPLREARSNVTKCASGAGADVDYYDVLRQFRVIFVLNDSFTSNISSFAKCLNDTNKRILYGYNFQISGSDPFNGRLSTN